MSHYWDKSENHTIELLLDDGILTFPDGCEKCGTSNAYRFKNKTKKTPRCSVAGCRHQRSLFQGSAIFEIIGSSMFCVLIFILRFDLLYRIILKLHIGSQILYSKTEKSVQNKFWTLY